MLNTQYGRLTVIQPAEPKHGKKRWTCSCACGGTTTVYQACLRRGSTTSCGCAASGLRKVLWAEYREPAFWARVARGEEEECWAWTGLRKQSPKNPTPYGSLGWKGRVTAAHRVAFEIAKGEIPEGAMVLHTCDNTLCCNPAHLYLGDHAQNMRDMVTRRRRMGIGKGETNGRAKLSNSLAEEIRRVYAAGVSQQVLADRHGVSQNTVSKIIRNQRYT